MNAFQDCPVSRSICLTLVRVLLQKATSADHTFGCHDESVVLPPIAAKADAGDHILAERDREKDFFLKKRDGEVPWLDYMGYGIALGSATCFCLHQTLLWEVATIRGP